LINSKLYENETAEKIVDAAMEVHRFGTALVKNGLCRIINGIFENQEG